MIENYLLEELITFAHEHTLAKTAAALNVTQPTITRGMQKLETMLAVRLFDRQPNRITLTPTGQLAAQEAERLLTQQRAFVTKIQNYEQSLVTRTVETTLPGPLVLLAHLKAALPNTLQVKQSLITDNQINEHLISRQTSFIFSNQEILTADIESRFIGSENLVVHLQRFMYRANQPSITFAELKGISFVVLSAIGIWKTIIQQAIPDAKFLYHPQRTAFTEITKYSDFPYFSTNFTTLDRHPQDNQNDDDNRVAIPISDDSAHMPIYVNYLVGNRHSLTPLFTQFEAAWPN
ncbi:LysR family transcriptional regulator [Lactiplantibacillus argentoratensis]|uniref:LysR family transcriptional regulator n=1 Tax=Lactiplantibacillus argentoratensis TaxID=271881 RepID=A0ABS5UJM5_9LACO|nr:LysR family transcriptional regulator [Lactiplantibacillus argentoratensis]MBT1138783.1 LysR family transcriptional regulator [Lactiplantibacillus argentoratensis]MBT1141628.1 LysR family transcriptional regulator [Lactiplantibacillus argentoratensis]